MELLRPPPPPTPTHVTKRCHKKLFACVCALPMCAFRGVVGFISKRTHIPEAHNSPSHPRLASQKKAQFPTRTPRTRAVRVLNQMTVWPSEESETPSAGCSLGWGWGLDRSPCFSKEPSKDLIDWRCGWGWVASPPASPPAPLQAGSVRMEWGL